MFGSMQNYVFDFKALFYAAYRFVLESKTSFNITQNIF